MGEEVDPRKKLKQFEGTVQFDKDTYNVQSVTFFSRADLLDARYELIDLSKPIIVKDAEEKECVIIEPSKVQSSEDSITLRSKIEEEE